MITRLFNNHQDENTTTETMENDNSISEKKKLKSVNSFIKENIKKEVNSDFMIAPDIDSEKLNNAIKSFGCEEFYQSILAIYDSTKFRSAKEGLVFTGEKMIYKNDGNHWIFPYQKIEHLDYQSELVKGRFGKENFNQWLILTMDGREYKLEKLDGILPSQFFNFDRLKDFLETIKNNFNDYKEENQLTTIAEMSEELKKAYLKIIVNMTFIDDEEIDEKELSEIFLLMTRLELEKETRFSIRSYISEISRENINSTEELINIISEHSESSHFNSIMISLAKDLININFNTKLTQDRNFNFLDENKELFELTDDEIELAYDTVENDYKIINEDLDDEAIAKKMNELGSKALAVGAPLGAVYLSGSVLGLSAAGMTSGLATLGMGGILGLSSMATGIGVAVLLGVGVYKGMQYLTGANKLDKYKARALFLEGIIKQNQKTLTLIMEDINFLVDMLNDVNKNSFSIEEDNNSLKELIVRERIKNKKLLDTLKTFTGAAEIMNNNTDKYRNSANRLLCPKTLDEPRLKSLTDEPTKKQFYELVIKNYEEKGKEFILKEDVKSDNLEEIEKTLKALGYFDMDKYLKGKTSEGVNKLKSMLG
jgi:hypothetical protein